MFKIGYSVLLRSRNIGNDRPGRGEEILQQVGRTRAYRHNAQFLPIDVEFPRLQRGEGNGNGRGECGDKDAFTEVVGIQPELF